MLDFEIAANSGKTECSFC